MSQIHAIGFEDWLRDIIDELASDHNNRATDNDLAWHMYENDPDFKKEVEDIWYQACDAYEASII